MPGRDSRSKLLRLQGLLVGAGALAAGLYPLAGARWGPTDALSVHSGGALVAALLVLVSAVLLGGTYPHHPSPGVWYAAMGLELLGAVALVHYTGGADSPAFVLPLLVCAFMGLQHSPWSGVAGGCLAAVLTFVLFVVAPDSRVGVLGVGMRALALPVFGGLGLLISLSGSRQEGAGLEEQARRLEEVYAAARQQAREREGCQRDLYDKQRRLAALMQVSRHLSTLRKPEELLSMIIRNARGEMNSGVAVVLLTRGHELFVAHSLGLSSPSVEALRTRTGNGLLGRLVVTGEILRYSEREVGWQQGLPGVREPFRTLLAVPLQAPQDRVPFGVLAVANILVGGGYGLEHEDYLKTLATDAAIAIKNISLYHELERSYFEIIQALAQAIEAKDPYTHGHVGRVRTYATRLARVLKLPPEEIELIAKAAILHDVGKLSIPDRILSKPGALSDEEFQVMKSHPENALHILKEIRSLPPRVIEMVLYHHERYDGNGYPRGLKGEEIPLGAQIIGLADTFDAMTSDRPYRKGLTPEEALLRMESTQGTQFNPRLLREFFSIFDHRRRIVQLEIQPGSEGTPES